MNKKQFLAIFARYAGKDFQICVSNYTRDDTMFNVSFTDKLQRTLNTTWSKTTGFINCKGEASYQTLRYINCIDEEIGEILDEELKRKLGI